MPRVPNVSWSFREGRYFDLWMLVHCLGGVTGGFSNVFFGLAARNVYIVGVLLMIAWEILEHVAGIRESPANRFVDVVVGVAGVAGALWVATHLEGSARHLAFAVSAIAFVGGGLLGWLARRRRNATRRERPA